jgi:hypothetical protein
MQARTNREIHRELLVREFANVALPARTHALLLHTAAIAHEWERTRQQRLTSKKILEAAIGSPQAAPRHRSGWLSEFISNNQKESVMIKLGKVSVETRGIKITTTSEVTGEFLLPL